MCPECGDWVPESKDSRDRPFCSADCVIQAHRKRVAAGAAPAQEARGPLEFRRDLAAVLNRHSREAESNTPDFILADYLIDCLTVLERATATREAWYGVKLVPGKGAVEVPQ